MILLWKVSVPAPTVWKQSPFRSNDEKSDGLLRISTSILVVSPASRCWITR